MNPTASTTTPASDSPSPLDLAFDGLRRYTRGDRRDTLLPIDQAVRSALADPPARASLEAQLLATLEVATPLGKEYVLSQLVLVGSRSCLQPLASLLADPQVSEAARRTLEALPYPEAIDAVRDQLPSLSGSQLVGAIQTLGARRDRRAVDNLERWLKDPDPTLAQATISALGKIGTPEAGRALRGSLRAQPQVGTVLAEAVLECASHLREDNHRPAATDLLEALIQSSGSPTALEAARRQLETS